MCVPQVISLLVIGLALVAGLPTNQERIVGGTETTIQTYPFSAALLYTRDFVNYQYACGGTLVNSRAVLTAGHCVMGDAINKWRIRVGSNFANIGGTVTNTNLIRVHPNYNIKTRDSDIAIVRSATNFVNSTTVRFATIAGANYNLPNNAVVWAIGWGATRYQGEPSETLRRVQVWAIDQNTCVSRYADLGETVTLNMLCTGWLDVGGRDQCTGDSGSPIVHGTVIVGVRSWGFRCGLARYPGVSSRVSRFSSWITTNAN